MIMRLHLLIIGLLCFSHFSFGQESEEIEAEENRENKYYVDLFYNRLLPINTFGDNLDRNLNGYSLSYLARLQEGKHNFLGFSLAYAHIGDSFSAFADSDVRTGSNFASLQLQIRHFTDFFFWRVEPFVDMSFGPQIFYTQTTTTFFDDGSAQVDFDETDVNMAYGVGVGFTIHIIDGFFITPKVTYTGGTGVTYLVNREDANQFPLDNFRSQTTQTNYINIHVGVSWTW